jgi:hypothetical protein
MATLETADWVGIQETASPGELGGSLNVSNIPYLVVLGPNTAKMRPLLTKEIQADEAELVHLVHVLQPIYKEVWVELRVLVKSL